MAIGCDYNCTELPSHQQNDCNVVSYGGIDAFAVIDCDHTITDFTNASQWTTNINSGKVRMIKGIKGLVGEANAIEGENTVGCGSLKTLDGLTIPFSFKDFNVNAANDDFYQKLNLRKPFLAWRMCKEGQIRVAEYATSFTAKPVMVPENNTEKQHYSVSGEIQLDVNDAFPVLYTEPTGIFG